MDESRSRKQSRVVLSEEDFQDTLEHIVERQYFPELPALRRQAAVLDRRGGGDIAGAVAIRRAARQLEQNEQALEDQEAKDEHDFDSYCSGVRKRPRPLHRETLSGFHARVTSEDNEEFDRDQRQAVEDNRERLRQVFAVHPVLPQLTHDTREGGSETPLLASDKFNAPPHRIQAAEWKHTDIGSNGLFFSPHHSLPSAINDTHTKQLANDACSTGDSLLMPPPARPLAKSGISSFESDVVAKQDLVEYKPKHTVEKRIDPSRTRFPPPLVLMPHPLANSGAESSTDYSTDASTDIDELVGRSLSEERRAYAKRQRRDQESLVRMTPIIVPGRNDGNESPIVTWGTVSSTPLVLGGKSFSLPNESDRDMAARRAELSLEKAKQRAATAKRSKTPILERSSTLTPAARALLERTSARRPLPSARSSDAFSSVLRSSYTPKVRTESRSSSRRDSAGKATPQLPPGSNRSFGGSVPRNITDGLLKITSKGNGSPCS